ncbi:MAG: hypothetical protein ACKN9P_11330 [Phenylobacterium sp.]
MTRMPKGQPRDAPDPEGEIYDRDMARIRQLREAEDFGLAPFQDLVQAHPRILEEMPRLSRPNALESFIPVIGPAWEAATDLQDGDIKGAALNAAFAVFDTLPAGAAIKGARAAGKGIGVLKKGSVTAGASAKMIRKAGLSGPGMEIHHSIPLEGIGRSVQDWRNHYAFLKVLPKEVHRRLHGSWGGKPRYDPLRRIWYGTTDWQKSVPTATASMTADGIETARAAEAPEALIRKRLPG